MGNEQSTQTNSDGSDAADAVHTKVAEAQKEEYARFVKRYHDAVGTKQAQEVANHMKPPSPALANIVIPPPDSPMSTDSEDILGTFEPRKDRRSKPSSQSPELEVQNHNVQQVRSTANARPSNGMSRPPTDVSGGMSSVRAGKRPAVSFDEPQRRGVPMHSAQPTVSLASPSKKTAPSSSTATTSHSSTRQQPSWYQNMKAPQSRTAGTGGASTQLARLKGCITNCKKLAKQGVRIPDNDFQLIRELLHNLPFLQLNRELARQQRILHNNDGLPQLFDDDWTEGVGWPWDVRADAEELYNRWSLEIFETDLLRGIIPPKPKTRNAIKGTAASLDSAWPRLVDHRTYGNNDLLNGQWWPTQLAALRDGAVGSSQGGISGVKGRGATSVILSGGLDSDGHHYPDDDSGNEVSYCGTDSTDGKPSAQTQHLIDSVEIGSQPVRLLRSSNLRNAWAPEMGFRYDGLYEVVSFEKLDPPGSPRQRHRFHLRRIEGQPPIRGGSGPEKRPTRQELEQWNKDRVRYGLK